MKAFCPLLTLGSALLAHQAPAQDLALQPAAPTVAPAPAAPRNGRTIVFMHGLFVTNNCWAAWVKYFEAQGYTCYAPAYPLKNDSPQHLKQHMRTGKIETLRLAAIINFYQDTLAAIGGKPILIGHSLGGNLVQILANQGYGSAGVCIHSGPPKGLISLKWPFLKSNLPLLTAPKDKPYLLSFKKWQYSFTNGMSLENQRSSYENYLVPESAAIAKDATSNLAKVDFNKPHIPLLFTAGANDHIIPASLNKRNAKKYADKNSVTDYKKFDGRNHFVIGADGWQEVAAHIATWLTAHPTPTTQAAK